MKYVDEFRNADATPYRALPWLFIVPGALLALVAGAAVVRRPAPAAVTVSPAVSGP